MHSKILPDNSDLEVLKKNKLTSKYSCSIIITIIDSIFIFTIIVKNKTLF